MTEYAIKISPISVSNRRERAAFVDLGRKFAASTPHSVPQLRGEQLELLDPAKNPFFKHADVQLFIAYRGGKPVGRISAHIDHVALTMRSAQGFGPGTGLWGYFDAEDEETAHAVIGAAEEWLRGKDMIRALGPISLSIWEEPGLLVRGHDHSPMIMMGHDPPHYRAWVESAGYRPTKSLRTYELDIRTDFPPLIQRIVQSGHRNERIRLRPFDTSRFAEEAGTVLAILNDAWSDNWGFVPFTEAEIAYAAKKLKPIIRPDINTIAEVDGKPVAFMMTLPDMHDVLKDADGKLFPFGWYKLLRWLRNPQGCGMRVPLMGVLKEVQNSRLASQLAFMMMTEIRDTSRTVYSSRRAEIGWILEDNHGMIAIAEALQAESNREYLIFGKTIAQSPSG